MKKNNFGFVAAFITLALGAGAATATGCGGASTSSLCADICACQRCTSNDLQACEDQGDKASSDAASVGCSSQFDDAVACVGAHVSCKGSSIAVEGCDVELAALSKCSTTLGVLGKDACQIAGDVVAARLQACGVATTPTTSGSGGPTAECSAAAGAQASCVAACVSAADCSLFVNDQKNPPTSQETQAFSDCVNSCQ
ncbi:MAG: hypothetical protein JWM93_3233 [Frankiales bacterium]|nr:hypothetical protein [Frankiales bacterium]